MAERPIATRLSVRSRRARSRRCRLAKGSQTMPHHREAIIELEKLEQLSRAELRALWTKELAEKPPQSLGRDILALGIAYARQERLYGGLSKPVAKKLDGCLCLRLPMAIPTHSSFPPTHL